MLALIILNAVVLGMETSDAVLSALRVLTIVRSMRRVVCGLLAALPCLSSIAMVLLLVYYVFGVIATHILGDRFPDWFGTLGRSLYTLFQIMAPKSWSIGIVRPLWRCFRTRGCSSSRSSASS